MAIHLYIICLQFAGNKSVSACRFKRKFSVWISRDNRHQLHKHFLEKMSIFRGRVRTDSMTSVPQTGTFHEEHHERRRLELQPRTKPIGDADENQPVRKSSIFGEAKPVDTSEKERQVCTSAHENLFFNFSLAFGSSGISWQQWLFVCCEFCGYVGCYDFGEEKEWMMRLLMKLLT